MADLDIPASAFMKKDQWRQIPRSDVERALAMLRLPVTITTEQIKVLPIEQWRTQFKKLYDPKAWGRVLSVEQRKMLDRRFVDVMGAYDVLLLWKNGKIVPVTAEDLLNVRRAQLREVDVLNMIQMQKDNWERDAPRRLSRIQAERNRVAKQRAEQSGKIMGLQRIRAEWDEFEKTWKSFHSGKPARWFNEPTNLAMRREAWFMWRQGMNLTVDAVRALEQRFHPDPGRFTPEQKKAALDWYNQMLRATEKRQREEYFQHAYAKMVGYEGVFALRGMFR